MCSSLWPCEVLFQLERWGNWEPGWEGTSWASEMQCEIQNPVISLQTSAFSHVAVLATKYIHCSQFWARLQASLFIYVLISSPQWPWELGVVAFPKRKQFNSASTFFLRILMIPYEARWFSGSCFVHPLVPGNPWGWSITCAWAQAASLKMENPDSSLSQILPVTPAFGQPLQCGESQHLNMKPGLVSKNLIALLRISCNWALWFSEGKGWERGWQNPQGWPAIWCNCWNTWCNLGPHWLAVPAATQWVPAV